MRPPPPISFYDILIYVVIFLASMAVMLATVIFVLRKRQSKVVTFEAIHISDLIKLILSILSFVTVCITLILLVLQNRVIVMQTQYASQSVESNVFGNITNQALNADDICLRFPEVRPYFYAGRDITQSDPLYDRVYAAAEYLLDYFDSLSTQLKKYPQLWRYEKDSWEANIIDMFAWSPVLCRYLEANKDWYNDNLLVLKKAGEMKRQKGAKRENLYR